MDYDDVIRKSIKDFMQGKMPTAIAELKEEGIRYTPDYFDKIEAELMPAGKGKASKKKKDDADAAEL